MTARSTLRRLLESVVGDGGVAALGRGERRLRRARRRWLARQVVAHQEAERRARASDLTALAQHFKTDKWGAHRYTPHYQHHLQHLRDRPVKLLEIGIGGYSRKGQGGASLRMWKEYFPCGQIFGLDISDKSFVEEDRIRAFQGDQSDPVLLAQIVAQTGTLDVIIDDGSHVPEHVIASFRTLFPLLAGDGIYVVEDTQTSYWPEWGGEEDPESPMTSVAMLKRLVDGLNHEEFVRELYEPSYTDRHVIGVHFYHNMVVIEKGVNDEGTRKKAILKARYAPSAPNGD